MMSGYRLIAAVTSALLGVTPALNDPSMPASRPPFVPCPVASVPATGEKARPDPPAPPPARNASNRTVGGERLSTAGLTVPAGTPRLPATLTGRSWLVADLDTGAVLGACGPHEYEPPASVQKLLLALTLLPKLDPAQVVEITQEDLNFERGSSAVGLLLGGRYPVETLWLGLLLNSGNDAANVLARIGGGEAGMAGTMAAMNAEARRLGAFETRAVTPSGLDAPGQFTSAYDLALIARASFALEDFWRYTITQRAQIPAQPPRDPRGYQIQNNNPLLSGYAGALGGKTGFTDISRHTFVGAAERSGRRLVVTMLGAETRPVRAWQQSAALLDWGFALPPDTAVGRLVTPEEVARARATRPPTTESSRTGPGPTLPADGWSTGQTTVLGGMAAAIVSMPLVVLLIIRRRHRRSPTLPATDAGRGRRRA